MRCVVKWLILISLPILTMVGCLLGYYAWGKLSYAGYSCGSFATMDSQIGWVLAGNAHSCLGARAPFSNGPPWFHATVNTDQNGFRARVSGGMTPSNGIFIVGDSWTFGFGIDYEDSLPAQLAKKSGLPSVTVASPAYSSAQALLLAQRWVEPLTPRAIIILDNGFWNRAACSGRQRPEMILKPCYWQADGSAEAELVLPPDGQVIRWSRFGMLPGGVLGAGESGWLYFLVARPIAFAHQMLVRLGLASGFAHDFRAEKVDESVIQIAALRHMTRLAEAAKVPVVLLDPGDIYAEHWTRISPPIPGFMVRVGRQEWAETVESQAALLPADQRYVPHDGHYAAGMNRLIAALAAHKLRQLGVGD